MGEGGFVETLSQLWELWVPPPLDKSHLGCGFGRQRLTHCPQQLLTLCIVDAGEPGEALWQDHLLKGDQEHLGEQQGGGVLSVSPTHPPPVVVVTWV